jgi:GAF domain-containing protein
MTSFLGVPIKVLDEVYGNLYLTDKVGWSEFTRDDEALVSAPAVTAGIAIENARLHGKARGGRPGNALEDHHARRKEALNHRSRSS